MAPKIFITGSTGYIGGSVFDTIISHHPEYEVAALLRRVPEGFEKKYPKVRIVHGDYDSREIITEEASKADVVVHNGNSDHEPSIKAILAGLIRRGTASSPAFLLHLSGTGIVADWRSDEYLGRLNPKVWDDDADIAEITSRPDPELHRNVDKLILEAAAAHPDTLKTAIMCPPDIYGQGTGPGKQVSIFMPLYLQESLSQEKGVGRPFYVGEGKNARSWVHIADLMRVYLKVAEAAVAGGQGAEWGGKGYYFAATQDVVVNDIASAVAQILKSRGLIPDAETKSVTVEKACELMPARYRPAIGRYMYASTCRSIPSRAKRLFGYSASHPTFWETLEAEVDLCLKA